MNSNNPLVSVVIPVYNAADFLADTIESMLQQTYKNIELILVDDGSTDASFEIAKRYESSQVTVVTQVNKGASAARNYGVALSKGDFIQYLDADDFLHPQKIEHQLNTLASYTDMHLIGGTWQRFAKNLDHIFGSIEPETEKEVQLFDNVQWLIDRPMMIPNTWLVSRKLISMAGPWDEQLTLNDDGDYFYRVTAASAGIVIDRKAATYYRSFNFASLSSRSGRKSMLSWLRSVRAYKALMQQIAGDRGNESVNKFFYHLSYSCLNEFPDLYQECKSEMYYPEKTYPLGDKFVENSSRLIGLANAKRVRELTKLVKHNPFVRKLINKTKTYLGKPVYH